MGGEKERERETEREEKAENERETEKEKGAFPQFDENTLRRWNRENQEVILIDWYGAVVGDTKKD